MLRLSPQLHQIDGLESFSKPRFWPKDDAKVIGTVHVAIAPSRPHEQAYSRKIDRVVERVDSVLRRGIPGLEELTIQVEPAAS